ncbi:MAG: recombination protein O N-terminal domain-containing protein [Patescibacteria group bacterium]
MHHIYTTPAFIIHSSPHGEAGKFLLLFTKDFGMIGATAQGIRLGTSKLRYHMQDFNFSNVSVVRGKEVWRVTGAHELEHAPSTLVHLKILKLLKRLLQGEDKNERLFEILKELYRTDVKEEDFECIECLTVLRILNVLGYIRPIDRLAVFLNGNSIDRDIIGVSRKFKSDMLKAINQALKESHL